VATAAAAVAATRFICLCHGGNMQHATCEEAATLTDSVNETYFLRLKLMWQKFANAWQLRRTVPCIFNPIIQSF